MRPKRDCATVIGDQLAESEWPAWVVVAAESGGTETDLWAKDQGLAKDGGLAWTIEPRAKGWNGECAKQQLSTNSTEQQTARHADSLQHVNSAGLRGPYFRPEREAHLEC